MLSLAQAILLGLFQGVTELFPISSLGHSVLLAWLFNWNGVLAGERQGSDFFLPFVIAMHVATGFALLIFYRETWARLIRGFFRSLKRRRLDSADSRLAWLLIFATIPAGLLGLIFEHTFRNIFAKPLYVIFFLFLNGCLLLYGDRYQKRAAANQAGQFSQAATRRRVSEAFTLKRAAIIGVAQVGALFAGISRSGITMISGLMSGLNHEDAARFSFLLATPIIFGAGIYKLPDFFANLEPAMRVPVLAGSLVSGIAAYVTVRYLDKYFRDKTLRPFGIYCICASLAMLILGLIRGHF
jgi:undecaprenyl-diphosphatase